MKVSLVPTNEQLMYIMSILENIFMAYIHVVRDLPLDMRILIWDFVPSPEISNTARLYIKSLPKYVPRKKTTKADILKRFQK